jgi:hypothetical protein
MASTPSSRDFRSRTRWIVYYEAYERGDFAAARRGFEWLRDMAPEEAYHHQMLGSIAAQESRSLDAIVEFLAGDR